MPRTQTFSPEGVLHRVRERSPRPRKRAQRARQDAVEFQHAAVRRRRPRPARPARAAACSRHHSIAVIGNAASFLRRDSRSSCTAQTGRPSTTSAAGGVVIVRGDAENLHVSTGSAARSRRARDRDPAHRLAALAAPGEIRERRQQDEIQHGQQRAADQAGDRRGDAQIAVPQPLGARMPDVTAVRLRRDARQLRVGVVHVKHFVPQDLLEDRARLRIVVDQLAVDRKSAGGGFLRHVQERQQSMIRFAVDAKIVEAMTAWQRIAVEQHADAWCLWRAPAPRRVVETDRRDAARRSRARDRGAAAADPGVTSAARRISRPPSVSTSAKVMQLSQPAIDVAPDPPMDRTHHPVERRAARHA